MDRANSSEGNARGQASLRLPAQAGGGDQVQQKELSQKHARELVATWLDGDDEPENQWLAPQRELPLGVAREQAPPQLLSCSEFEAPAVAVQVEPYDDVDYDNDVEV